MSLLVDLLLREELALLEDKQAFILDKQGPKIWEAYERDRGQKKGKHKSAESVIKKLASASEKYLQWIVNRYVKNEFSLEDLPRVKTAMATFDKGRRKLEKQDVNEYKSFLDLERALDPLSAQDLKSNRQIDRERAEELFKSGEAKLFFSGDGVKIIVPKTKEASCYFGRGTKWCTAGENSNMFDEYSKRGGLYIIFTDDGEKYQVHGRTGQFADDADKMLSSEQLIELLKKYPAIKTALSKRMKSSGLIALMDVESATERELEKIEDGDLVQYVKSYGWPDPKSKLWKNLGHALASNHLHVLNKLGPEDKFIDSLLASELGMSGVISEIKSARHGHRREHTYPFYKLVALPIKVINKLLADAPELVKTIVSSLHTAGTSKWMEENISAIVNHFDADKEFREIVLDTGKLKFVNMLKNVTDDELYIAYRRNYNKDEFLKELTGRQREAIRWRVTRDNR